MSQPRLIDEDGNDVTHTVSPATLVFLDLVACKKLSLSQLFELRGLLGEEIAKRVSRLRCVQIPPVGTPPPWEPGP